MYKDLLIFLYHTFFLLILPDLLLIDYILHEGLPYFGNYHVISQNISLPLKFSQKYLKVLETRHNLWLKIPIICLLVSLWTRIFTKMYYILSYNPQGASLILLHNVAGLDRRNVSICEINWQETSTDCGPGRILWS